MLPQTACSSKSSNGDDSVAAAKAAAKVSRAVMIASQLAGKPVGTNAAGGRQVATRKPPTAPVELALHGDKVQLTLEIPILTALMVIATVAVIGYVGWKVRNMRCCSRRRAKTNGAKRTVLTMSQVTFKRQLKTPRFYPLAEDDHGAWPEGR